MHSRCILTTRHEPRHVDGLNTFHKPSLNESPPHHIPSPFLLACTPTRTSLLDLTASVGVLVASTLGASRKAAGGHVAAALGLGEDDVSRGIGIEISET